MGGHTTDNTGGGNTVEEGADEVGARPCRAVRVVELSLVAKDAVHLPPTHPRETRAQRAGLGAAPLPPLRARQCQGVCRPHYSGVPAALPW